VARLGTKDAAYLRVRENSMPKLREAIGGPKQRLIVKELYLEDMSLQCYGPSYGCD